MTLDDIKLVTRNDNPVFDIRQEILFSLSEKDNNYIKSGMVLCTINYLRKLSKMISKKHKEREYFLQDLRDLETNNLIKNRGRVQSIFAHVQRESWVTHNLRKGSRIHGNRFKSR